MQSYGPIFSDPTQRRWIKIRRLLFYVAGTGTALLLVLIASILLTPLVHRIELSPPKSPVFHKVRGHNRHLASANRLNLAASRFVRTVASPTPTGSTSRMVPQGKLSAFYVSWDDASFSSLRSHIQLLDQLYPQWIYLEDKKGNVELREDERVTNIAEKYPALKIIPIVMNYDQHGARWMDKELNAALNDSGSRQKMATELLKIVHDEKYQGLMVDFEYVAPRTRKNYISFLKALADGLHAEGKRLEVSAEFNQPQSIDYAALGQIADQIVLMAYDEHADTTVPGPVCSISWFVHRLEERLRQIPPGKVSIALGNYGYDWAGRSVHPRSLGFNECLNLASESGASVDFDPTSLNPTFEYADEKNQVHKVWYLDATTAYNEMQAALARGVSSFALWRLGIEDNSLWGARKASDAVELKDGLETIDAGSRLGFEGSGDMIFVKENAKPGYRKIEWDPQAPYILNEQILEFPTPFTLVHYGQASKKVALTFDDGPDPKYTGEILDVLKKFGVHANFFVIGLNAEDERGLVRREYAEGHEVGSHTFTHPNIGDIPLRQLELELNSTQRLLEAILGHNSLLFRPPFDVDADPSTPEEVLPIAETSRLGYLTVGVGIDPTDYARPGTNVIVERVLSHLGESNIILLHDGGGNREQTVEALPILINEIRKRGIQIVPLSELLGKTRAEVMPPLTRDQRYLRWANMATFGIGRLFISFSEWGLILGVSLGVLQFVIYSLMAIVHRREKLNLGPAYSKPVTVIVPAYNEEKVIEYTIKSLLQSEGVELRIIAVDDGSTDNTLAVLRQKFGDNPKVRIVTQPNGGKASALNHGLEMADTEVVVTLDSDTIFTHDCVQNLVHPFNDPSVTAVAGNAKVGNRINILTRWQALEYVTTQNFIRRSNSLINCITVVPGAVGAWRKDMILKIGGYKGDTLAEDGELTIRVLEAGGKIVYADGAVAWTEAPQTLKTLFRQRFRWMYGTFQTAWKHKRLLFDREHKPLGWIAMPNMWIFQVVFPFTAPLMDLMMFVAFVFYFAQRAYHPADFAADQLMHVLFFYSLFLMFDLATAILSIFLEPKREDFSLLVWLPWQRFFYRQLNHVISIKSMFKAMRGEAVGWGHITRNATHLQYFTESELSEQDGKTIHQTIVKSEDEATGEGAA